MEREKLKELYRLLMSKQERVFRIQFIDGETYELSQFYAFDDGYCIATVVQLINVSEGKQELFKTDSVMQFNLKEVVEARDCKTDRIEFSL
jgi:hypothetical protein